MQDWWQNTFLKSTVIPVPNGEYASEFRYRNPVVSEKDVVIAISQSGETADTLAAIELAKSRGATILGICNVVGSSIARTTHAGSYTHAGPEIGVASEGIYCSDFCAYNDGLDDCSEKGTLTESAFRNLLIELDSIPEKVAKCLDLNPQIEIISEKFKDAANFLYLERKRLQFPCCSGGST